jgi:hypothetical protein
MSGKKSVDLLNKFNSKANTETIRNALSATSVFICDRGFISEKKDIFSSLNAFLLMLYKKIIALINNITAIDDKNVLLRMKLPSNVLPVVEFTNLSMITTLYVTKRKSAVEKNAAIDDPILVAINPNIIASTPQNNVTVE